MVSQGNDVHCECILLLSELVQSFWVLKMHEVLEVYKVLKLINLYVCNLGTMKELVKFCCVPSQFQRACSISICSQLPCYFMVFLTTSKL